MLRRLHGILNCLIIYRLWDVLLTVSCWSISKRPCNSILRSSWPFGAYSFSNNYLVQQQLAEKTFSTSPIGDLMNFQMLPLTLSTLPVSNWWGNYESLNSLHNYFLIHKMFSLPVGPQGVANNLIDVVLKGYTVIPQDQIHSWINAIGIIMSTLPEAYWRWVIWCYHQFLLVFLNHNLENWKCNYLIKLIT